MKQIVIIGGGGLGRQALAQLSIDPAHGTEWSIAGFLDERGPQVIASELQVPWLGYPALFEPAPDHVFVSAVGDPHSRRLQVEPLAAKGAQFMSTVTRCLLGSRLRCGPTFFCYDVAVGVDSQFGNHGFIDHDALVGHDVVIGDYVHIGARCVIAGYVKIGNEVLIHSGALLARNITVGDGAVIGMGAVVLRDVPAGATVLGNPARVISSTLGAPRDSSTVG